MPPGVIAVVGAMGVTDAGVFGAILCARMRQRGVAGLVTDGVVRDGAGVLASGLPVWCQGVAAPPRSSRADPDSDAAALTRRATPPQLRLGVAAWARCS
jgi:regulator of RNase E activity RraA